MTGGADHIHAAEIIRSGAFKIAFEAKMVSEAYTPQLAVPGIDAVLADLQYARDALDRLLVQVERCRRRKVVKT